MRVQLLMMMMYRMGISIYRYKRIVENLKYKVSIGTIYWLRYLITAAKLEYLSLNYQFKCCLAKF